MKLELHRISVGKLAFGAQTGVSGGVLTINKDDCLLYTSDAADE